MGGGTAPTITGDHQNRITDYTAIVVEYENSDRLRCVQSESDGGGIDDAYRKEI